MLVCYSGGVDSALLLAVAHQVLGPKAVGMTAVSPSLAPAEREQAVRTAQAIGAEHRLVESYELEDSSYACNDENRCFFCKTELYRIAEHKRLEWGLEAVVNGSNLDDADDYRPGARAAGPAGVRSPLGELGFTKDEVRAAARLLGLEVWDKPASACLASRIPYGTAITAELLSRVAEVEEALQRFGFRTVRVRCHGDVARIELGPEEVAAATEPPMRQRIAQAGHDAGFRYVALDLDGYRRGSHNEALPEDVLRQA